jgi:hypothetical protein
MPAAAITANEIILLEYSSTIGPLIPFVNGVDNVFLTKEIYRQVALLHSHQVFHLAFLILKFK